MKLMETLGILLHNFNIKLQMILLGAYKKKASLQVTVGDELTKWNHQTS